MSKRPEYDDMVHHLIEIGEDYNHIVDNIEKYNDKTPDQVYHDQTGYSLRAHIIEAIQESNAYKTFPKQMIDHMDKTYAITLRQLTAYERFTKNPTVSADEDFAAHRYQQLENPNNKKNRAQLTGKNIAYAVNMMEKIKNINIESENKQAHTKYVDNVSDLRRGDVIQLYKPYQFSKTKKNTKNNLDSLGQNRFYGVLGQLKNGDILAISFYGHNTKSPDADILKHDSKYAYPTSRNATPAIDPGRKQVIQIPKDVVIRGSQLVEKAEAASYGKPYREDPKTVNKIKVLEMSPENKQKLERFYSRINNYDLDLAWKKDKEAVVAASPKGRRMLNAEENSVSKYNLKAGIYDLREMSMDRTLNRQAAIRERRYGDANANIKIQTKYQQAFQKQQAEKNRQKHSKGRER